MFRNIKLVLGYNVVTMGHELWLQWKETEKNMKKRAKYVFFHHFSGGGFLQTVYVPIIVCSLVEFDEKTKKSCRMSVLDGGG